MLNLCPWASIYFGGTPMRKTIIVFICVIFLSLFIFTACDEITKKEQEKFDQIVVCIDAGDYTQALALCNGLSEKEIAKGKPYILDAIKKEANDFLEDIDDWCFNDSDGVIDIAVLTKFKTLSTILNVIKFDSSVDISNVKTFIDSIIALEPYAKWNDFANNNGYSYSSTAYDYLQKAINSSSSTMFDYYINLATQNYKSAYYECYSHYNSYGCGYNAEYYKTFVNFLEDIANDKDSNRNKLYDEVYNNILDEWGDVLSIISDLIDKLPDKIY